MKETLLHDTEKGEIFFNNMSMHVWRRVSPHRIQSEFEGIIGPAARVIINEAFKKVSAEIFLNLAAKYAQLEKENPSGFAIKLLRELRKYGYGVPELMLIDERHGYAKIRVANCFNKEGYGKTDKPVCYMMEGILASLFERVFRRKAACRETKCSATGEPYCEFTVTSYNISVRPGRKTPRRPKEKLVPVEIGFRPEKGEIVFKKTLSILVPRGTHLRLEQESQKIIGKGTKRIFYLIGRTAGTHFTRKNIAFRVISLIARMNKKKAFSKMAEIGSMAGSGRYEFELDRDHIKVKLFNSFNAQGAKSKEPLCHVVAGVISGTSDMILGKRVHTEEVKCIAMGNPFCEFHVKPEKE